MVHLLQRIVWGFLKKLTIEPPYDPAIPLLGVYLEKTILQRSMYLNVHCSTIYKAKIWKKPKCTLTEEWIKKMWYIYTTAYYSSIKKNKIMPFSATWMDLEIIILS